jgi:CelD/BcsL family acetyltransferase involved in cellulose biosynthesis/biotin carboxylase
LFGDKPSVAFGMSGIIVFLESDPVGDGISFFHCARDLGLQPILLSTAPEAYLSLAEFASMKVSAMTERSVVEAIKRLGRDQVRGIWSVRDNLLRLAANVSKTIGRPSVDPEAIKICCDKFRTRQTLVEAGVNDLQFALARTGEEAARMACALGGRVFIKPRSLSGGVGVRLCCGAEEAKRHHGWLARMFPKLRRSGALIELAVEGEQYSVQTFDGRSIGVVHQDVGPPPAFITIGSEFPWLDDTRVSNEIVEHAERALAAVGHDRGPGSVDIRYGNEGPRIIEINPRLADETTAENIRLAAGIDLVEATIRFACGLPYDLAPRRNRGSATRWLLRPDSPVSNIVGGDKAVKVAGVSQVGLLKQRYGREGPAKDHRDRVAFVIAEADGAAQAGDVAALGLCQLRLKPINLIKKWRLSGRKIMTGTPRHAMALRTRVMNFSTRLLGDLRKAISKASPRPTGRRVAYAMSRSSRLSYSIIQDDKAFDELKTEWEELFQDAAVKTPFLRYSWLKLCWDRQRDIRGRGLFIVVVRKADRPVLIAPFVIHSGRLSFLDSLTPQYNDLLVVDSIDKSVYVDYLWESLGGLDQVRRLVAKRVRDDSPLIGHLATAPQDSETASYKASFIDLAKFGDWDIYLQNLSRKVRQDHRRRLRLLEKRGAVEFRMADGSACSDDMAWLFTQKREWLDQKDKSSSWLKAPRTEELFTAAAQDGIDSGRTWLSVLSVDGATIAVALSFREGSTLYLSKIAYDPTWGTYSPGRTLNLLTIQRAFQEGIRTVDLMMGRYTWKNWLATGSTRVRSFACSSLTREDPAMVRSRQNPETTFGSGRHSVAAAAQQTPS